MSNSNGDEYVCRKIVSDSNSTTSEGDGDCSCDERRCTGNISIFQRFLCFRKSENHAIVSQKDNASYQREKSDSVSSDMRKRFKKTPKETLLDNTSKNYSRSSSTKKSTQSNTFAGNGEDCVEKAAQNPTIGVVDKRIHEDSPIEKSLSQRLDLVNSIDEKTGKETVLTSFKELSYSVRNPQSVQVLKDKTLQTQQNHEAAESNSENGLHTNLSWRFRISSSQDVSHGKKSSLFTSFSVKSPSNRSKSQIFENGGKMTSFAELSSSKISAASRRFSEIFTSFKAVISDGSQRNIANSGMEMKNRRSTMSMNSYGKSPIYEKIRMIGQGSYSVVFIGKSRSHKGYVALKEMKSDKQEGIPSTAIREASILRSLKHPNVVALFDVISTDTSFTLVMEYMNCDLKKILKMAKGKLPIVDAKIFSFQLLQGMAFCHRKKIVHRDLKPENILVSNNGILKIADFGLAREQTIPSLIYSSEVVTLWYRSPDVLLGSIRYGPDIDMWSIGTIIGEMLGKDPLFTGKDTQTQIQRIVSVIGNITEDNMPGCENLPNYNLYHQLNNKGISIPMLELLPSAPKEFVDHILEMLVYNPQKRITCSEALKDPIYQPILCYMSESPSLSGVMQLNVSGKKIHKFFTNFDTNSVVIR